MTHISYDPEYHLPKSILQTMLKLCNIDTIVTSPFNQVKCSVYCIGFATNASYCTCVVLTMHSRGLSIVKKKNGSYCYLPFLS